MPPLPQRATRPITIAAATVVAYEDSLLEEGKGPKQLGDPDDKDEAQHRLREPRRGAGPARKQAAAHARRRERGCAGDEDELRRAGGVLAETDRHAGKL